MCLPLADPCILRSGFQCFTPQTAVAAFSSGGPPWPASTGSFSAQPECAPSCSTARDAVIVRHSRRRAERAASAVSPAAVPAREASPGRADPLHHASPAHRPELAAAAPARASQPVATSPLPPSAAALPAPCQRQPYRQQSSRPHPQCTHRRRDSPRHRILPHAKPPPRAPPLPRQTAPQRQPRTTPRLRWPSATRRRGQTMTCTASSRRRSG
mmetsp:Transcript_10256/g.33890  ORF Transcript_10256/g.33890 Transcript_10256/m.33890 type:complete len:213 (-) Transcript_10256:1293-1931(-)|eukprot:scaffold6854_cov118-Isochrysis_galbana.AAC.5